MIKRILVLVIAFTSFYIIRFKNEVEYTNSKIEEFYSKIKSDAIISVVNDEIYLIFDYESINKLKDNMFEKVSINKENEGSFILIVEVNELFFNKQIKRKFYIRKGDLYV